MPIVFNVKIAICQIIAPATLACHSTSRRGGLHTPAVALCVSLPSCPGHAHMHEGCRRRFQVMQGSAIEKEMKFDYRLITA